MTASPQLKPRFSHRCRGAVALALVAAALSATPAWAEARFTIPGGGGDYTARPKTFSDMRFRNVIRQQYDYSCGSAALASMLKYHYNIDVTEAEVLTTMFEKGDKEKIRTEGFSLLDMKNYLEEHNLQSSGFRDSLDKLARVGIPAIVLINRKGYSHFVVVSGVTKEKVLIGDPSLGLMVYNRKDFEAMWNHILFVITEKSATKAAKRTFNSETVWAGKKNPNFQDVFGNADLSRFTLSTFPTPNYY